MPYRNINPNISGASAYRGSTASRPLVAPGKQGSFVDDLGDTLAEFAYHGTRGAMRDRGPEELNALRAKKEQLDLEQFIEQGKARKNLSAIVSAIKPDGSNLKEVLPHVRHALGVRAGAAGIPKEEVEKDLAFQIAGMADEDALLRTNVVRGSPSAAGSAFTLDRKKQVLNQEQEGFDRRKKMDNDTTIQTNNADNIAEGERNTADNVYENLRNRANNARTVETNNADNAALLERAKLPARPGSAGARPQRSAVTPTNVDDLEKQLNKQLGVDYDEVGNQTMGADFPVEEYTKIAKLAAQKIDQGMDTVTAVAEAISESVDVKEDQLIEDSFIPFMDERGRTITPRKATTAAPAAGAAPAALPDPLGLRN